MQKIILIISKKTEEISSEFNESLCSVLKNAFPKIIVQVPDNDVSVEFLEKEFPPIECAKYTWVIIIDSLNNPLKLCFSDLYQNVINFNNPFSPSKELTFFHEKKEHVIDFSADEIAARKALDKKSFIALINSKIKKQLSELTGASKTPVTYISSFNREPAKLYSFSPKNNKSKLINEYLESFAQDVLVVIIPTENKSYYDLFHQAEWISEILGGKGDILMPNCFNTPLHGFAPSKKFNAFSSSCLSFEKSRSQNINAVFREFDSSYKIFCFIDDNLIPDQNIVDSIILCAKRYEIVSPFSHVLDVSEGDFFSVMRKGEISKSLSTITEEKTSVCEGCFVVRGSFLSSIGGFQEYGHSDLENQAIDISSLYRLSEYGIFSKFSAWLRLKSKRVSEIDSKLGQHLKTFFLVNHNESVYEKYKKYILKKDDYLYRKMSDVNFIRKTKYNFKKVDNPIACVNEAIRKFDYDDFVIELERAINFELISPVLRNQLFNKPSEFLSKNKKTILAGYSRLKCTALIKSTGRIPQLARLIVSLKSNLSNFPIIILDDSGVDLRSVEKLLDVEDRLIALGDVDVGLSEGRNILLENCQTDFFLLLDDDFLIMPDSNIISGLKQIDEDGFDIIGGAVFDYGYAANVREMPRDFRGFLHKNARTLEISSLPMDLSQKSFSENRRVDLVMNFFIGRKKSIMKNLWDKSLKLGEHLDFFLRAKENNLKISYQPLMYTMHYRPSGDVDPLYQVKRNRAAHFIEMNFEKHGIDVVYKNGELIKG